MFKVAILVTGATADVFWDTLCDLGHLYSFSQYTCTQPLAWTTLIPST